MQPTSTRRVRSHGLDDVLCRGENSVADCLEQLAVLGEDVDEPADELLMLEEEGGNRGVRGVRGGGDLEVLSELRQAGHLAVERLPHCNLLLLQRLNSRPLLGWGPRVH